MSRPRPHLVSRRAAGGRTAPTVELAALGLGLFTIGLCIGLTVAGCAAAPERGAEPAASVQTYNGAGEVVYLPSESVPALTVRHQAIDDFVDIDGEVVGMPAMTMPFPLADGVSLEGIEEGDAVRFTLEVEWSGDPPYRIARIEKVEAPPG